MVRNCEHVEDIPNSPLLQARESIIYILKVLLSCKLRVVKHYFGSKQMSQTATKKSITSEMKTWCGFRKAKTRTYTNKASNKQSQLYRIVDVGPCFS